MRARIALVLTSALLPVALVAQGQPDVTAAYSSTADRIITAAVADKGAAWNTLARFTDYSGNRLSGSAALERGIDWLVAEMKKDGLENVHTEAVMVPHWVRGRESADIVEPAPHQIVMLGLGDSVGTPADGIQAVVLAAQQAQLLGPIPNYEVDPYVMDAADTVVEIHAMGKVFTHVAYALDMPAPTPESAARVRLRAFVQSLTDIATLAGQLGNDVCGIIHTVGVVSTATEHCVRSARAIDRVGRSVALNAIVERIARGI